MERLYKNEWMKPQCWAAVLVLALAVPASAAPELYRWIDVDGSVRYTPNPSRVPNARRNTLVRVESGMAPAPPMLPAGTATPGAIHAPPGEPGADPFSAPAPPRRALATVPANDGASIDAGPPHTVASQAPVAEAAAAAETAAPELESRTAFAPVAEPKTESAPIAAQSDVPADTAGAPAEPAAETHAAVAPPQEVDTISTHVVPPSRVSAAPDPPSQALRSRRDELVAQIADDENTLKALISAVQAEADDRMIDSDELREIARRLPVLQEELRALDEQSARLEQR